MPFIKNGMESNYSTELVQLLREYLQRFFAMVAENKDFYPDCTRSEARFVFRYHSQAILGLFQNWNDEDTEHLEEIVHMVYRLIMDGVPPMKT